MHDVVMIGDLDISPGAISTSQVFDGCVNRTQVATFMSAMAWEKLTKGLVAGVIIGAVGTIAISIYLKKR